MTRESYSSQGKCYSGSATVLTVNMLWHNNNNNLLHLYSTFLDTQSALHRRGESPQPPPMCSIHLDDPTAAILRQNEN